MIEGDGDALRLGRVRRAFNDKCPKLAASAAHGRISVLVLEGNDIQLKSEVVVRFDRNAVGLRCGDLLEDRDRGRSSQRSIP